MYLLLFVIKQLGANFFHSSSIDAKKDAEIGYSVNILDRCMVTMVRYNDGRHHD